MQEITFASSDNWNIPGPRSDVIHDRALNPRNKKVGSLTNNFTFDARESVENNCPVATFN